MSDEYRALIQKAKKDYSSRKKMIETKKGDKIRCPQWYDLMLDEPFTEELNLWNYWQGVGFEHPKLMVVGQDWGKIDASDDSFKNIQAIANDPNSDLQYLSNCPIDTHDFETDRALIEIFNTHLNHLDWHIEEHRYPELYFTNLCLGYREDKTTGNWRQSWLSDDAEYFKKLVLIKRPEVIVCLGRATSETAYKALTGNKLQMPDGFYGFIDNQGDGLAINVCDEDSGETIEVTFIVMAHPGGMGAANRKSAKGGGKNIIDDWAFLKDLFQKED